MLTDSFIIILFIWLVFIVYMWDFVCNGFWCGFSLTVPSSWNSKWFIHYSTWFRLGFEVYMFDFVLCTGYWHTYSLTVPWWKCWLTCSLLYGFWVRFHCVHDWSCLCIVNWHCLYLFVLTVCNYWCTLLCMGDFVSPLHEIWSYAFSLLVLTWRYPFLAPSLKCWLIHSLFS